MPMKHEEGTGNTSFLVTFTSYYYYYYYYYYRRNYRDESDAGALYKKVRSPMCSYSCAISVGEVMSSHLQKMS